MKYLLSVLVFLSILFSTCSEEPTSAIKKYEIEIIEPSNNFVLGQGKGLIVKLRVETTDEIKKIVLYQIFPTIPDTLIRELFKAPFIDTVGTGYEVTCLDSLRFNLVALAYYIGQEEIRSNFVSGIASNEIPSNNLLNAFNYSGYDLDSNLVAEGTLYLNYDPNRLYKLSGRSDINYNQGDSVYEAGAGICISSGLGPNNEFELDLTYCTGSILEPSLNLSGIWNDTLLVGERFTYALIGPPLRYTLGTYKATRK